MAMSSSSRTFTITEKFNDSSIWNIDNRCLQESQSVDFHLHIRTDQKSIIEYIFEFFITIKYSGSGKDIRIFKRSFYGKAVNNAYGKHSFKKFKKNYNAIFILVWF